MIRHFDEKGKEYVDFRVYANMVGRASNSVRAAIYDGNRFRKLEHIREGARLYVKLDEYYIYPFIASGKNTSVVYHYETNGEAVPCEECTLGKRCPKVDENGEYIGHSKWEEIKSKRREE